MLNLVLQEDDGGCGIACLAMVLGVPYNEVAKHFLNDFDKDGLKLEQIMDYLGNAGFSIIYKSISHYTHINFGQKELLKPFAPIHIVKTMPYFDIDYGHVVVMDAKGKFYCPSGKTHAQTKKSYAFTDVIGIYGLDYFVKPAILKK